MGRLAVLPPEMPNDLDPDDGALWEAVAVDLDAIATRVSIRASGFRLGQHISGEIAGTAAEIRASIAIMEAARG